MSKKITINGRVFEHIKTREYLPVSVFKSNSLFLRTGSEEILKKEIRFHRNLLKFDFPVPEILEEGKINGDHYYIETSLGERLFGDIFAKDFKKNGGVSEKNFLMFLDLAKKFAKAQIAAKKLDEDEKDFYSGIHVDFVLEELPGLKDDILNAFGMIKERSRSLPYVLTHGDFNPYNILEKGVIDFGSIFYAPAGFDLVTAIYNAYSFPRAGDYEMKREFEFSTRQIEVYFNSIDEIYAKSGLPPLTKFIDDFILCRLIWATARMGETPNIQKWRYERFEEMLKNYLSGRSLRDLIVKIAIDKF